MASILSRQEQRGQLAAAKQQKIQELGLEQMVHAPPYGNYLLDSALTDIPEATAAVLPAIAYHRIVQVQVNPVVPKALAIRRKVWKFAEADWERLREELEGVDCETKGQMAAPQN